LALARKYFKCLGCGRAAERSTFTKAALGRVPVQFLQQRFVDRGKGLKKDGTRGGAVIWDRRPMSREEAEYVARAISTASEVLVEYLERELPSSMMPQTVLAEIDDDEEFDRVTDEWIKEAEEELNYRKQLREDEYQRRGDARGRR
jgi:hypothetical protein